MPIDAAFLHVAQAAFNPYVPASGTEHVAFLLYSLARMIRPRSVVEYGSGYTTLFLLAALADNVRDVEEERAGLRAKTPPAGDLATVEPTWEEPRMAAWFADGGKACGVDPAYYLDDYRPHLFSFEDHGEAHEYSRRLRDTADALHVGHLLTHVKGGGPSIDRLPARAFPIDMAWNDHQEYRSFFDACWPHLNPRGGLMMFHNTTAFAGWWEDMQAMKDARAPAGDLEILTLQEPHKLSQNSCTILRRTSEFRPRHLTGATASEIFAALMRFQHQ